MVSNERFMFIQSVNSGILIIVKVVRCGDALMEVKR